GSTNWTVNSPSREPPAHRLLTIYPYRSPRLRRDSEVSPRDATSVSCFLNAPTGWPLSMLPSNCSSCCALPNRRFGMCDSCKTPTCFILSCCSSQSGELSISCSTSSSGELHPLASLVCSTTSYRYAVSSLS